jgi:hypothetical protein
MATMGVAKEDADGRRLIAPDSRKPPEIPALTKLFAASVVAVSM